jgi:alcohol dehydrogenase (NADP+)
VVFGVLDLKGSEFKGYAIHDNKHYTDFKVIDFQPKTAGDYDIDVAIKYCGVCASDHHSITGGWGETILPLIAGHEVYPLWVH